MNWLTRILLWLRGYGPDDKPKRREKNKKEVERDFEGVFTFPHAQPAPARIYDYRGANFFTARVAVKTLNVRSRPFNGEIVAKLHEDDLVIIERYFPLYAWEGDRQECRLCAVNGYTLLAPSVYVDMEHLADLRPRPSLESGTEEEGVG